MPKSRPPIPPIHVTMLVLGAMATTAAQTPAGNREWLWPLDGHPVVIRRFDPPPLPWLPGHRGVDLQAPAGSRVSAAGAGTVGYAGPLAGLGVVTVLHRSGLRTTYLPVRASVRPGQTVRAGQMIGTVQAGAGHCPVTCLHWGLLRGPGYLDPLLLLGIGQVRLLPVWDRA